MRLRLVVVVLLQRSMRERLLTQALPHSFVYVNVNMISHFFCSFSTSPQLSSAVSTSALTTNSSTGFAFNSSSRDVSARAHGTYELNCLLTSPQTQDEDRMSA